MAVETGVDGLDVVIGTSSYLREHSHGKDMTYIINVSGAGRRRSAVKDFAALRRYRADIGRRVNELADCD